MTHLLYNLAQNVQVIMYRIIVSKATVTKNEEKKTIFEKKIEQKKQKGKIGILHFFCILLYIFKYVCV